MNIERLISKGALFVINHSAGKDSQAMTIYLKAVIPAEQLVVIHSHLPEVEWEGTIEHIENTIEGLEFHIVQAKKTFFEMVEHRQKFPDANNRQCTSDLKRGPIEKKIRALSKLKKRTLLINCMGIRAEESPGRAKKKPFTYNHRQSKAGRKWYTWHLIFELKTREVWDMIAIAGQQAH
jgi:3'-phosphoadenosine 5'-phosphosulfate sulfotransferase (PAPS reductase)/FAD synthetase